MPLDRFHLTKKDDEWRLEKAGTNRARVKAQTKADAVKQMREYMQTHEGSVVIHKEDGAFQEERTYPRRKDPKSSPG